MAKDDRRSEDQDAAIEKAFAEGKLPEEDRRAIADALDSAELHLEQIEAAIQNPAAGAKTEPITYPLQ